MEVDEEGGQFSEATLNALAKHNEVLSRMEQTWRSREIAVPTNDRLVMLRLRELKEPIALFGEGPEDRRDRLRQTLARIGSDVAMPTTKTDGKDAEKEAGGESESEDESVAKITDGGEKLKEVRTWLTGYSLQRARERVLAQQRTREDEVASERREKDAESACSRAASWSNSFSLVGDERPLSACAMCGDGAFAVTAAWSGSVKLWKTHDGECVQTLHGHTERVLGVAMHPHASATYSPSAAIAASSGADGLVHLWSMDRTSPLATLRGHSDRANRVAFHPSGRMLASTSADLSWRLWDLESGSCIIEQRGHSRPVFGVAFQCDGSVAVTSGSDAHVRVWDLRTGSCVCLLEGHVKDVLAVDFSPNGYTIASGSEDNTVRLWDLRRKKCAATIPAHGSLVSAVKFDRDNGDVLVSGSFDNTVRLWSVRRLRWKPIAVLKGHENKVIGLDISAGLKSLITASYDRTWKLWTDPLLSSSAPDGMVIS